MSQSLEPNTLPALPLPDGVVLPGMVVTIAPSPTRPRPPPPPPRTAASCCSSPARRPLRHGRRPRHGRVDRRPAGRHRRPSSCAPPAGPASAPASSAPAPACGSRPSPSTSRPPPTRPRPSAPSCAPRCVALFEHLGDRQVRGILRSVDPDDPGGLADLVGWWPELSTERRSSCSRRSTSPSGCGSCSAGPRRPSPSASWPRRSATTSATGSTSSSASTSSAARWRPSARSSATRTTARPSTTTATRIDALEAAGVADDVVRALRKELGRFERMPEQNMERGWIQGWLDTVLGLPWTERTDRRARRRRGPRHARRRPHRPRRGEGAHRRAPRRPQAARAERGIDEEGTARRKPGAILALVGPPGVGKTSLGESVARALGRQFVRVALGGVRDEAEIRGHRRTYVGAQPGRIVRAITEAGTMNPVVLLDEVDKVGSDWRGDPSAALLEVLDPAQNHTFRDHYLEVDLDLSDVLFIATANVLETIPGPLLDRLELIRLDGYTEDEKVAIARDHLLAAAGARQRPATPTRSTSPTPPCTPSSPATPARPACASSSGSSARRCARSPCGSPAARPRPSPSTPTTCASCSGRERFHAEEIAERTVGARRGHRPRRHRRRRRRAVRRGHLDGRRAEPAGHRPARRRDEGVGPDRALVGAQPPRRRRRRRRRAGQAVPRALPRRRGAQGRPVGRHHHDDRARVAAHRPAGAPRGRHDRRGHAVGPGAARSAA